MPHQLYGRWRAAWGGVIVAAALFMITIAPRGDAATVTTDAQLVRNYHLSMDKLQRYAAAAAALRAACETDPLLTAPEQRKADDHAAPKTMPATIAKVGTMHWYHAYFEPRGLTPTDVVVMPLTLSTIGMLLDYKVDVSQDKDVSPEQVRFYKQHRAQIEKLDLTAMCRKKADR